MKTQFTLFRKFIRHVCFAAIVVLLAGCGGGGGGSSAPSSTSLSSTTNISYYIDQAYAGSQSQLSADLQAVERTSAASGNIGAGIINSGNAKVTNVQAFLSSVITYVKTVSASNGIDKPAIIILLNGDKTTDLAWLSAFTTFMGYSVTGAEIAAISPTVTSGINLAYLNAIAQINAL